jgi:CDP-glucose 4,6-dehydratase
MAQREPALEDMGSIMKGLEAFRGRSVFVTGHTGFKGSWLTIWLNHLGARVSGYSLTAPTAPNNFSTSRVRELLASHASGDVRDTAQLQGAIEAARPDVIFHLAAQPLVRRSYVNPQLTLEVNVMGTTGVLESVRKLGRPCVVIIVTSDKCYENHESARRHTETDSLGGSDPYSASKAAAEIVVEAYRESFFRPKDLLQHGVKVASVRAGNVIGGGDWAADRIVPDTVKSAAANQTVRVRNPKAIRPWQHVLEPLSGYLTLAARMLENNDPALCSGWNFGPNPSEEATVRDVVETLLQSWKSSKWEDASGTIQPHEENMLRLSNDKARVELGWRPRWSFREAVKHAGLWYHRFYSDPSGSTREFCWQDISDYEATIPNENDSLQPFPELAHHS